jgi:hypothetical protein
MTDGDGDRMALKEKRDEERILCSTNAKPRWKEK